MERHSHTHKTGSLFPYKLTAVSQRWQNRYLQDKMSISMMGLHDISSEITVPGTNQRKSFHIWMLSLKSAEKSINLSNTVEKDPNNVLYFITKYSLKAEAEIWLDNLYEMLRNNFIRDKLDLIVMEEEPSCSYRLIPMEDTDGAVSVYNTVLSGHMMEDSEDAGIIEVIEEDILKNYCKAPPVQSTHSRTHHPLTAQQLAGSWNPELQKNQAILAKMIYNGRNL
eukprot:7423369-Ditylum_brightwellii.AAC.1